MRNFGVEAPEEKLIGCQFLGDTPQITFDTKKIVEEYQPVMNHWRAKNRPHESSYLHCTFRSHTVIFFGFFVAWTMDMGQYGNK